jgi:hypothetical protein
VSKHLKYSAPSKQASVRSLRYGYSAEEVMDDENLTDALNSYVNNELVSEMDLKYGSVIINLVYKK